VRVGSGPRPDPSTSAFKSATKLAGIPWARNWLRNGSASRTNLRPVVSSVWSLTEFGIGNCSSKPGV
jgi:hypothetical protein